MSDQIQDVNQGMELPKSPLETGSEEKSGVGKVEKVQKVKIGFDRTDEQVLQFNQDTEVELIWDEDDFRELSEAVERQLRYQNLKNYLTVKVKNESKAKKALEVQAVSLVDPLGMNADYRLKIRPRRGWHQCWKSPGMEFDSAMAAGYKQVRKRKATGKKDKYGEDILENVEPGYENGEVLKIMTEDGKVELIAVEVEEQRFRDHLKWMSEKSTSMYRGNKQRFNENVEELNRRLDPDKRMRVIDEVQ